MTPEKLSSDPPHACCDMDMYVSVRTLIENVTLFKNVYIKDLLMCSERWNEGAVKEFCRIYRVLPPDQFLLVYLLCVVSWDFERSSQVSSTHRRLVMLQGMSEMIFMSP